MHPREKHKPPQIRRQDNPWPEWPHIYRVASAHEEGVERVYAVSTQRFIDDGTGKVKALELVEVEMKNADGQMSFAEKASTAYTIPADLVLLAMGFVGAEKAGLLQQLGIELTERGNVKIDKQWQTSVEGVYAAGDMQRGQSLIVWAIAEGRSAAASVDAYLMGSTDLPAPL